MVFLVLYLLTLESLASGSISLTFSSYGFSQNVFSSHLVKPLFLWHVMLAVIVSYISPDNFIRTHQVSQNTKRFCSLTHFNQVV